MGKKIQILFLGTQMEVAGAQRILLSQAQWFHSNGYPVQVAFFYDKQGVREIWQAAYPFPIISLEGGKPDSVFNIVRLFASLINLFRLLRGGPDAIITFTPHSNLLGLPLAWLAGVPVRIGTYHGNIEGYSDLLAWLHGRLINSKMCGVLVCVSKQVKDFVANRERIKPERLVVIENGVAPLTRESIEGGERIRFRRELGLSPARVLLVSIGRLTPEKGHKYLIDAIAKVAPDYPNAIFALAGDGPLRPNLEDQALQFGIQSRVKFLGKLDDITNLLLSSDVLVQPSISEGLSIALLEGLMASLPVVATRIEGFTGVVEDEVSALLVPPRDAKKLAIAMERMIKDNGLRKRIAKAGHRLVERRYSIETMCRSYEELIQKLLADVP